jgi:large subunit ribosomal protein L16
MLFPKQTKFKKHFKGLIRGKTIRGSLIQHGQYALKTIEEGRITSKQIEAGRKAIVRHMQRMGFIWIRIFPHTPVTAKPSEIRMGKGKGVVNHWVARVQRGQILYEISGIPNDIAIKSLAAGAVKLSVKTKQIKILGL